MTILLEGPAPVVESPAPPEVNEGPPVVAAPAAKHGRGKFAAIVAGTAIAGILAGFGLGYLSGAGTRSDLATANASISSLTAQKSAMAAEMATLTASKNQAVSQAKACVASTKALQALDVQWTAFVNNFDALMAASTEAAFDKILTQMNTQWNAIQKAEGAATSLANSCTTSTAVPASSG